MKGRDIICLSSHFWDERWFRKQEFMSRFAAHNRVLFVEPSFSMARKPEGFLREVATNRWFLPSVEARQQSLHLFKPPRGLPKWSDPRIEALNYRWYGSLVARAARELGFRETILWTYSPRWRAALDVIPHEHLVFDLVDDLAAYAGESGAMVEQIERSVSALVQRTDLLVVTAKTLLERYGPEARTSVQVANGFDAGKFSPDRIEGGAPRELLGIPRPIMGFIGTLFGYLDFELLERVARTHGDKSLVLVGPTEAHAEDAVAQLVEQPNVYHLGAQPQAAVPAFVANFDVCLNPFRQSRVAKSVNPLKVYEYLAMGRPVVSTPMEALQREEAAPAVAFADGAEDFCAAIERCLLDDDQAARESRRKAVADYSWQRLFERLDAACDAELDDRRAEALAG
jgi:glycosyltransferase involved in cell wall biosynthesis